MATIPGAVLAGDGALGFARVTACGSDSLRLPEQPVATASAAAGAAAPAPPAPAEGASASASAAVRSRPSEPPSKPPPSKKRRLADPQEVELRNYRLAIVETSKTNDAAEALRIFDEMASKGLKPAGFVCSTILSVCARGGGVSPEKEFVVRARRVFDSLAAQGDSVPNEAAYTSMIRLCAAAGERDTARDYLRGMIAAGVAPRQRTFAPLLASLSMVPDCAAVEDLFRDMRARGIEPSTQAWASLIAAYARAGRHDDVFSTLEEMSELVYEADPVLQWLFWHYFGGDPQAAPLPRGAAGASASASSSGGKGSGAAEAEDATGEAPGHEGSGESADETLLIHGGAPRCRPGWRVARVKIDATTGICPVSRKRLQSLNCTPTELSHLAAQTETLCGPSNTMFRNFREWLEKQKTRFTAAEAARAATGSRSSSSGGSSGGSSVAAAGSLQGFEVIIDGPNVGFFNQNFEGGALMYTQIDSVVRHFQSRGARVLLVIGSRWLDAWRVSNADKRRPFRRGGGGSGGGAHQVSVAAFVPAAAAAASEAAAFSTASPQAQALLGTAAAAAGCSNGGAVDPGLSSLSVVTSLAPPAAGGELAAPAGVSAAPPPPPTASSSSASSGASGSSPAAPAAAHPLATSLINKSATRPSSSQQLSPASPRADDFVATVAPDAYADSAVAGEIVARWQKEGIVYRVPPGNNDDWFWLYAAVTQPPPRYLPSLAPTCTNNGTPEGCAHCQASSVGVACCAVPSSSSPSPSPPCSCVCCKAVGSQPPPSGVIVVSNDYMRDHHFSMLAPRSFLKWRERHQTTFYFSWNEAARGPTPTFRFPRVYSHRMQHDLPQSAGSRGTACWHFPVAGTANEWLVAWRDSLEGEAGEGEALSVAEPFEAAATICGAAAAGGALQ